MQITSLTPRTEINLGKYAVSEDIKFPINEARLILILQQSVYK